MEPDDFLFSSDYPIDKVVHTGTATIVNNGATAGTVADFQTGRVVSQTIPVPTTTPCVARFVWSIDGGANWQSSGSRLWYTYTANYPGYSVQLGGVQGAVAIGADIGEINIRTLNGSHGTVNVNSSGQVSYTPISRTFTVKYALFSLE